MIGIYKIENIINNKVYIGSSNNIERRWKEHKRLLNNNKHHSIKLQRAWNKYGSENFKFSVLEECEVDRLLYLEQYYIDKFKSYFAGYNSKDKTKNIYTMDDYISDLNNKKACNYIEKILSIFHVYFTDKTTINRIEQRKLKEYEMVYIIDILNFIMFYFKDAIGIRFNNNDKLDRYYFIEFDSEKLEELTFSVFSREGYVLQFTYLFKDRAIILISEYYIDKFEPLGILRSEISKRFIGKTFYQRNGEVKEYDDYYMKFIISKNIFRVRKAYEIRYGHIEGFMDKIDDYFHNNNLEYSTLINKQIIK